MKIKDIIIALICGLSVSLIANDFLQEYHVLRSYRWIVFTGLPVLAFVGLFITEFIGKKVLFVKQAGKHVLTGSFADVIDIKIFQMLFLFVPGYVLLLKSLSFLIATLVKYFGNKYWAFQKPDKDVMKKEAMTFFIITLGGLVIDIVIFYYFVSILGAQFSTSVKVWTEFSIIIAAVVAGLWNFLGYKFVVFKK